MKIPMPFTKRIMFSLVAVLALATLTCAAPPTKPVPPLGWVSAPETQNAGDFGPVVTDIENHLYAGHPYRDNDRITWTHEGTHGVNSLLRNKYGQPTFYVLKNNAYTMNEPLTKINEVARMIPWRLRGDQTYSLYCLQSIQSWNDQPSYLFDEWVAYTNGTIARYKLGIKDRRETIQYMFELGIYSTCVPYTSKERFPVMRDFLKWQWERTLSLVEDKSILDNFRSSDDADVVSFKIFMCEYFGSTWTYKHMGFKHPHDSSRTK